MYVCVCVCDSVLLWIRPAESRLCHLRTSFNAWNTSDEPRISVVGGTTVCQRLWVGEVRQDMIFVRFSEKLHEIKTYLS